MNAVNAGSADNAVNANSDGNAEKTMNAGFYNADSADIAGNVLSGFAIADNGRAKTSARGDLAINTALFAPGLSHAFDGTVLRVVGLSPCRSRARERHGRPALILPNTPKRPNAVVLGATGVLPL
jgi:hypothetical protein